MVRILPEDLDPACHFDADPDPTYYFDADPDLSFRIKAQNLENMLKRAQIGSGSTAFLYSLYLVGLSASVVVPIAVFRIWI